MACTFKYIYDCHWAWHKVHHKKAWLANCRDDLNWYEFDPTKVAGEQDDPYDDLHEAEVWTDTSPIPLCGFFDEEGDEEMNKKWGIVEKNLATMWLSLVLLEEASYTVTMRDEFEVDGVRYAVEKLDEPTGMGEKKIIMVLGLRPTKEGQ